MKHLYLILLLALTLIACEETQKPPVETPKVDPVPIFVNALNQLDKSNLASINEATALFDSLRKQLPNSAIADTLFYPHYWVFYNEAGEQAIKNFYNNSNNHLEATKETAEEFGFLVRDNEGGIQVSPASKQYLKAKVIPYLSEPLAKFVRQQLNEFTRNNPNIAQIGMNTLFWEKFAKQYPNFHLSGYANQHFRNYHLPQLLIGNEAYPAFGENDKFNADFPVVYGQIILKEGESMVTPILEKYLKVLKDNKYERTAAVDTFLAPYIK